MKKTIFYLIFSLFNLVSLAAIFSFTSRKKVSKQQTTQAQSEGNIIQAETSEATVDNFVNDKSVSIEDNGNVPADEYRPNGKIAAKILYGTASYYHNKFNGRQTSNGEIFSQQKMTGASNFLPLNEWVRVTNLTNGKSIVVKITDRMHPKMTRVIDLSKSAAKQLSYIGQGLAKVKVVPLGKKKPAA